MSQVKPGTLSTNATPRAIPSPAWALLLIPLVAALVLAVVLGPRDGSSATRASAADQLAAPALVEFRAGERMRGVPAGEPLRAPAVLEFRQGERVGGVAAGDPLLAPAMVEFRQSERVTDVAGD
jgi:hypothetical protein